MARPILLLLPLFLAACRGDQGVKTFNAEPVGEITSHGDGDEDGMSATASVEILENTCFGGWDDTEVSLGDASYSLVGEAARNYAGFSVAMVGDVDGDGLADVQPGTSLTF